MKKSEETRPDRTRAHEQALEAEIREAIANELKRQGVAPDLMQTSIFLSDHGGEVILFVQQTATTIKFPGHVATKAEVDRAIDLLKVFVPKYLNETHRLNRVFDTNPVGVSGLPDPVGWRWRIARDSKFNATP